MFAPREKNVALSLACIIVCMHATADVNSPRLSIGDYTTTTTTTNKFPVCVRTYSIVYRVRALHSIVERLIATQQWMDKQAFSKPLLSFLLVPPSPFSRRRDFPAFIPPVLFFCEINSLWTCRIVSFASKLVSFETFNRLFVWSGHLRPSL